MEYSHWTIHIDRDSPIFLCIVHRDLSGNSRFPLAESAFSLKIDSQTRPQKQIYGGTLCSLLSPLDLHTTHPSSFVVRLASLIEPSPKAYFHLYSFESFLNRLCPHHVEQPTPGQDL